MKAEDAAFRKGRVVREEDIHQGDGDCTMICRSINATYEA